jgi:hypothetical protein
MRGYFLGAFAVVLSSTQFECFNLQVNYLYVLNKLNLLFRPFRFLLHWLAVIIRIRITITIILWFKRPIRIDSRLAVCRSVGKIATGAPGTGAEVSNWLSVLTALIFASFVARQTELARSATRVNLRSSEKKKKTTNKLTIDRSINQSMPNGEIRKQCNYQSIKKIQVDLTFASGSGPGRFFRVAFAFAMNRVAGS